MAALVTVVAVIAVVPYIALQLKAVSASLGTMLGHLGVHMPEATGWYGDLALYVAVLMALFATLFGTRHIDATEHQDGLMLAIAAESVVKLLAFLAVGIFVVFVMFDGPSDLFGRAAAAPRADRAAAQGELRQSLGDHDALSFFAILLLPRQFHVAVVENNGEDEVRRAAWLFPLYLVLINLFVVPVAVAGLITFPPAGVDSDMYMLALPLSVGSDTHRAGRLHRRAVGGDRDGDRRERRHLHHGVERARHAVRAERRMTAEATAEIGAGLSAPGAATSGDMARMVLATRRIAILATLALAYVYYRTAGTAQLAQIGLLAFAAVAQFAPAFFGGLFWRGANARGAIAGIVVGTLVWAYTLLLPNFVDAGLVDSSILTHGPFGLFFLKPQGLLGIDIDPLTHGVLWSLGANIACFVCSSLTRPALPIEQLQANVFIDVEAVAMSQSFRLWRTSLTIGELIATVARYLGEERARRSFESFAETRRISLDPHREADIHLLRYAEFLLSSAIGAASSRLVLSLLLRKRTVSTKAALKLLDDASAAFHYNREVLQTALDHVRQGISVFDKDMRLICWNRRFGEMLDIPRDVMRLGVRFDELVRFEAIASGLSPSEHRRHRRRPHGALHRQAGDGAGAHAGLRHRHRGARRPHAGRRRGDDLHRHHRERECRRGAGARQRDAGAAGARAHRGADAPQCRAEARQGRRRGGQHLQDALPGRRQPRRAAAAQRRPALHHRARRARRWARARRGAWSRNVDASLDAVEEILGAILEISRLDTGALKAEMGVFRLSDLFEPAQDRLRAAGRREETLS